MDLLTPRDQERIASFKDMLSVPVEVFESLLAATEFAVAVRMRGSDDDLLPPSAARWLDAVSDAKFCMAMNAMPDATLKAFEEHAERLVQQIEGRS